MSKVLQENEIRLHIFLQNRFYVESRLNTNLVTQLHQLFVRNISDDLVQDILGKLTFSLTEQISNSSSFLDCLDIASPLIVSPAIVQTILKHLHTLNNQYCRLNMPLFSRHLPGLSGPMSEEELAAQIEADKQFQEQLKREGFQSGNQSRKRSNSDLDGGFGNGSEGAPPPPPPLC